MEIRINRTMPMEYMKLMARCGRRQHHPKTVVRSLRDCLFMAGLYDGDRLIAFGRVCGDGAMYFLVTDLMVDPAYGDRNLEAQIYKEVDDFLLAVAPNDSQVMVMADKAFEPIIRAFGYHYVDEDYRTVMVREQQK